MLRLRAFPSGERRSAQALAEYFERILETNPWRDAELPSLVYEDERGHVAGFVGVLPRRMVFQGQPIRVAVATQLMVAPEHRGLAARQLFRALFAGPQDLTFSDGASDVARRIWESLGGVTSTVHSLVWTRVFRPGRHVATRLAQKPARRAALLAARPFLTAADALFARFVDPLAGDAPPGSVEPLDASALAEHFSAVAGAHTLRPVYEDGSLPWVLAAAAEKRTFGTLEGRLVRGPGGDVAGWYLLYVGARGSTSQVLQLAARRSAYGLVLRHLCHHARRAGASAVSGQLEPALLPELDPQWCLVERGGPWTLVHSTRAELRYAIERGDAFLSRLDGEWWLSF